MLAVDDEELALGRGEGAGDVRRAVRPEGELLVGEQQDGARDGRLVDRRLVEVLDRLHLGLRHLALEASVGFLDLGDELRDFVVVGRALRGDLLTLAIEAADEADLLQELVGRVGDEVVDAVFLTDLGSEHCHPVFVARRESPF